ncbi:MAG: hypothetical protein WCO09_01730 [bacterium]
MVFGYQQGGSFSQHKQALGFDAATTEQMRLKQIAEQRKREQQIKARQDSQSKKIKLRIIQDEIGRRSMEARRIEANISKLSLENRGHVVNYDLKINELKNKIKELEKEIEKNISSKAYDEKVAVNKEKEIEIIKSRKKMEDDALVKLRAEEKQLEVEIKDLDRLATQ